MSAPPDPKSRSSLPASGVEDLLQLGLGQDAPLAWQLLREDMDDDPDLPAVWKEMKDYQMVRRISNGGMGVVYLAWQKSLERFVAVKFLLPELNQMPQFVERFRREAKAAASLRHPNIVTVHEVGMAGERTFFSMDFVEGCDLSEILESGPLPWERAARYCAIIAETVEFAHSRWVLHRDLKPSNVLIDLQDVPHLTDFGLAGKMEVRSHMTLTGHVLGSPYYLSPEQASGHVDDLGPACDVYAIGVILYECLTGHAPFQAPSVHEMLRMIRETPAELNEWRKLGIPRDLVRVCLKCLEKDPRLRYASAGALAEDLRRCLNGDPIRTRFPSFISRQISWTRRNAKLSLAVSLGMMVMGFVTVGLMLRVRELSRKVHYTQTELHQRAHELAQTYRSLAEVQQSLNRISEARENLRKAIELNALGESDRARMLQQYHQLVQDAPPKANSGEQITQVNAPITSPPPQVPSTEGSR